ncbi:MAG: hypothetical protein JST39_21270 [Bacteroidetes bacterium]|nr:hypothetical protein [Bacteroidota bacterium]
MATLVIATVATAVVGANLYLLKRFKHKKRLAVVSDAGYETAYDIHFPMKPKKQRRVAQ